MSHILTLSIVSFLVFSGIVGGAIVTRSIAYAQGITSTSPPMHHKVSSMDFGQNVNPLGTTADPLEKELRATAAQQRFLNTGVSYDSFRTETHHRLWEPTNSQYLAYKKSSERGHDREHAHNANKGLSQQDIDEQS